VKKPFIQPEPVQPPGSSESPHDVNLDQIIQITIVVRAPHDKEQAKRQAAEKIIRDRLKPPPKKSKSKSKSQSIETSQSCPSPEEFDSLYGVDPRTLELVQRWGEENHLRVVEASAARRCVVLSGSLRDISAAFGIRVLEYSYHGMTYFTHRGAARMPDDYGDIVQAVLGLDNRTIGDRHNFGSIGTGVDPKKVAKVYKFPKKLTGKGQRIGIIEMGGGFRKIDINAYFKSFGLKKKPKITVMELGGTPDPLGGDGTNNPASAKDVQTFWDIVTTSTHDYCIMPPTPILASLKLDNQVLWSIESSMDIELVGRLAPAAEIVVCFTPNNAQGKYHAWTTLLADPNPPSVISCSFGLPENVLDPTYVSTMDDFFSDAIIKGITVCCSSGDTGDGSRCDGVKKVNFPASSRNVLACGGTEFKVAKKVNERVWNEDINGVPFSSGGGFSTLFSPPVWQSSAIFTNRGLPDVAARADLKHGYKVRVGGINIPMGGTSSAAPLWGSLIAVINQSLGMNAGFISPVLYGNPKACFDIKKGKSGTSFQAQKGWDACTGLGTPHGGKLLTLLESVLL
jgi:kumamolisin